MISLLSKGLSSLLQYYHFFLYPTLTSVRDYWKNHSFDYMRTLDSKVMSPLFNMLSRFVIVFLPRSKCLLISWRESLSTMILEPKKRKSVTVPFFHHLFATKCWDQCHDLKFFECRVLSQLFHSPLSPSSRGFLVPLHFLP